MVEHIKKSHNKTLLLYHMVYPVRYRRKVFTEAVILSLREICAEGKRYRTDNKESYREGNLSATQGSEKILVGRKLLE